MADAATPAPSSSIRHCAVCGWPSPTSRCEACGGYTAAIASLTDIPVEALHGPPSPEDYPDLAPAFAAWHAGDLRGMLASCLATFGVTAPPTNNPITGTGWAFVKDSAAIYAYFDSTNTVLSVEAPILRVPLTRRAPMLRHLLELNARVISAARFTLRDDLVVLRWADRLQNLNPPKLCMAIAEVAELADDVDDLLSIAYRAPMVGPEAQAHQLSWSFLGQPRRLDVLAPGRTAAPAPSPAPSAPAYAAAPSPGPAVPAHAPTHAPPPPAIEASPEATDGLIRMWEAVLRRDAALVQEATVVPAQRGLLLRAALWLGWYEYGEACPATLHAALGASRSLLTTATPGADDVERAQHAIAASVAARGAVPPAARFAPEAFEDVASARTWFAMQLDIVASGPPDPMYRYPVGLGMLAELLVRADLPPDRRAWVREALETSRSHGPTAEGVRTALSVVRRLIS